MSTYKTPGVYVEEISTLPPSVAEVSTAVPAFFGYTAKGSSEGPTIARINTLLEYEALFGRAKPSAFSVTTHTDSQSGLAVIDSITRSGASADAQFLMHYSLSLYFKNGGGSCYVVSVGGYDATPAKADFEAGLELLEQEDEPTLIVLSDAVNLTDTDYHALCQAALAQCKKLGDRFTILDVKGGDVDGFRTGIGTSDLMYGAAYHPYLQTALSYQYTEDLVTIVDASQPASPAVTTVTWEKSFGGITVSYTGSEGATPKAQITKGTTGSVLGFSIDAATQKLIISNVGESTGATVVAKWIEWQNTPNATLGFAIAQVDDGSATVTTTGSSIEDLTRLTPPAQPSSSSTLASIRATKTALYNQIKTALADQRVVLPPSAAIAGIYAKVDRERGVWKAPANVSISSIIGPVTKITNDGQELLNVDPTAGKSINAIRAFTGKGTLVWGSRTLAGNDNEWRYVSVRRLFIMIEESAKKSTSFAVFEPNDSTTWLKVKGMVESYLYGLWERGALAGSTPESAYFVNVGLGKTMTTQDVLEGRMIIEIGIAAVRPAEFVVLRFTHKLQEA